MRTACLMFFFTLFSPILLYASAGEPGASMSNLPLAARSSISAALGRENSDYQAQAKGCGFESANASQKLTINFTMKGVEFRHGDARWGMMLRGYGYGSARRSLEVVAPRASSNRVEYQRGPLTEWYVNGPAGLEQGFTINEPPGKGNGQPLTVALVLSGNLSAVPDRSGMGLTLAGPDGGATLRYTGMTAYDATGTQLPTSEGLRDGELSLKVEDAGARYPVVIDRWVQLGRLTASDGKSNDQLGYSAAISGNTVVVGAPFAAVGSSSEQGAVYVFVKPANGWANMTETAKLTASDGRYGDFLGTSVAIDRDTVVAGAPFAAAVYVFLKPAIGWRTTSKFAAKLTATDEGKGDYFGQTVFISGGTVVAGAPRLFTSGPGAAYVFVKPRSGWKNMTETAKLTASDGVQSDQDGSSVAISNKTVVFGAPGHNSSRGAAYVFVEPASGWKSTTQTAELTTSDKAIGGLGWSVSVWGNTVVSGAPFVKHGNNEAGAAYIFVQPASGWTNGTETAKLTIPHFPFTFNFGFSVDIHGTMVVAGAPAWPSGASGVGSTYVFLKPASGWKTTSKFHAKLVPSDTALDDRFGFSVGVSRGTVVAGAPVAGGSSQSPGAAYVFQH
jgi:hypothetical protein